MDTDKEFLAIADDLVSAEANDLLDKQMAKALEWVEQRKANGEPADLRSMIQRFHQEPNRRGPVLAAYAAAMWRLLQQEGKL
jgi:hypothetical protein